MPFLVPALIAGGATLVGGMMASDAATEAAATQASAATEATKLQIAAAERAYERQLAERKPIQDIGLAALRRIEAGIAPGGEFVRPFTMGDVLGSERYKTLLEAGQGAVEQSAFSRGMGLSTPAAIDVAQLGQKLGVAEYDRTRAQLQAEREAQLAPLQSLAGVGVTQSGALGDIAAQSATMAGQAGASGLMAGAGAQAAGQVQGANIMSSALSNVGNQALQMAYLNRLFGGPNVNVNAPMGLSSLPESYWLSQAGGDYGAFISDERLKKDIKLVGKTFDGENIYTYRMRGGGPKMMGVMAQELEESNPQAVSVHPSGYRMVDYDMVS